MGLLRYVTLSTDDYIGASRDFARNDVPSIYFIHMFRNALQTAFKSIFAFKRRSFLTMLGIIIGIGAVITVVSVGEGGKSLIVNQIKSVGSNLIGILPGASEEDGPPASAMGIVITTLTYDDLQALLDSNNVPHLTAAAAYTRGIGTVSWANRSIDASFTGITSGYTEVENTPLQLGRFITAEEENSNARVAVLGSELSQEVFSGADPVGERIKINRQIFEVIGVFEPRGVSGFQNQDTQVFIPLSTAQNFLLGIDHVNLIRAKVDDERYIDQSVEDIKIVLRERHKITDPSQDDFSIRNTQDALEILGSVTAALQFFLGAIAGVSLLVGGIGIMNIMLVSVRQRTREIGLRKALGASASAISLQFLVEASVLTFLGSLIGIVGGVTLSWLIAFIVQRIGYDWDFVVRVSSLVSSLGLSIILGLAFGYYPARKASELDPITALRYE